MAVGAGSLKGGRRLIHIATAINWQLAEQVRLDSPECTMTARPQSGREPCNRGWPHWQRPSARPVRMRAKSLKRLGWGQANPVWPSCVLGGGFDKIKVREIPTPSRKEVCK